MRKDEFKRRLRQLIRKELSCMDLKAIVREQIAYVHAVQAVDAILLEFRKPPLCVRAAATSYIEVEGKVK